MNYGAIYSNFVQQCKAHPQSLADHYHHIMPKCMGGSDEADNLVRLTHRQHIFAHLLLYKIHATPEMRKAVLLLAGGMKNRRMNARVKRICAGQHTYFKRNKYSPKPARKVKPSRSNRAVKPHKTQAIEEQKIKQFPNYQEIMLAWPSWQKSE